MGKEVEGKLLEVGQGIERTVANTEQKLNKAVADIGQGIESKVHSILDELDDMSGTDLPFGGRFEFLNRLKDCSTTLVNSRPFENFVSVLILINSVLIGVEVQVMSEGGDVEMFRRCETMFLAVYTFEMMLRLCATNGVCLADGWLLFDTTLVITGLLELAVTLISDAFDRTDVGPVSVVRIARLLRTFRTVRLLRRFAVLWMMIRSFMDSLLAIAATMVFLLLVLYVFSCIGMQTITANQALRDKDSDFEEAVEMYFKDLPTTMLSLLQFVTLDSPAAIYKPLVKVSPGLIVYFIAIILTVSIGLMNLVTAAIVNGAFEQAAKDREVVNLKREQEKKKVIRKFGKLFRRLDIDRSGYLSQDEIAHMSENDRREMMEVLGVSDPMKLFHELDTNHDGRVLLAEFCNLLWQESVCKVPPELRRVDKRIDLIRKDMQKLDEIHTKLTTDLVYQTKKLMSFRESRGSSSREVAEAPQPVASTGTPSLTISDIDRDGNSGLPWTWECEVRCRHQDRGHEPDPPVSGPCTSSSRHRRL
eukprot:TRINITY_DN4337_c0_g1_i7.p1 TRINITY_DN4337_c0_g1~~TRINITY_DN4337_c0_g1_i7.p1  ORF type:complete len:533 (-),score=67.45 TRINITY_DN4337_c0_g1_i7:350-1948(-)